MRNKKSFISLRKNIIPAYVRGNEVNYFKVQMILRYISLTLQ